MASLRRFQGRLMWLARRKRDRVEYHLGWYETESAARAREAAFDEEWPPGSNAHWD